MHMHPQPDHPPTTRSPGSPGLETHMFDRDDLFLRERLVALRETAATLHPDVAGQDGVLTRTRRTIGRGLIAVGSAVAWASADLRDQTDARGDTRDAGLLA